MSDHMTAAEWRGYCAYQNDVPRDKNPYPEAAEWDDGWLQAQKEDGTTAYQVGYDAFENNEKCLYTGPDVLEWWDGWHQAALDQ